MTPNPQAQDRIRRYLLGQLTDGAREEIEQDLLTNGELFEELLVVEDELIDEYLGGRLSADEQAGFEKHFLSTSERHEKLRFGKAFDKYLSTQAATASVRELKPRRAQWAWTQAFFASPLRIAAYAVLALGLVLGIWSVFFRQSDVDKGLLALNAAYREQRPVEARISGLAYAPFSTTRGPGTDRVDQNELRRAELTLLEALNKKPTPAVHHALGEVYLAKKQFDDAIKEFEEALKDDPRNPRLLSDLGAAWLEKGKIDLDKGRANPTSSESGKGMEELGRSLVNLKKALELDANLLEALFNRALCHQYLLLHQQAEAGWREYLNRDSTSLWADEARRNLTLLEEGKARGANDQLQTLDSFLRAYRAGDDNAALRLYRHNYTSADNNITRALVDAFLRESASSQTSESLHALTYLGQLELRNSGDTYNSELARFYGSVTPQTRLELLRAREHVRMGYELFRQSKIGVAMEHFSRAHQAFDRVGDSAEALLAEYAIAHGAAVQPDLEKCDAIFARIIPICIAKDYKWLLAQCLSERAHLEVNLNNYSEAIEDGNRSLRLSEELQDLNGMLGSVVQMASLHLLLNDSQTSLSFLQRGLKIVQDEGANPVQAWGMYIAVSLNFSNLNLHRAALDYQLEALQLGLEARIPLYVSRSYEYTGLTYGKLNLYDQAILNVRRAYEVGQPLANDRSGQNMMASASLKLGDLYRMSGDQASALVAYDESARLYEALGFAHYEYAAHKGKFLSYLADNNDPKAEQELVLVLRLFEGYRERILEERQRNVFFDKEQDIYDLAIDFTYSRTNDPRRAFEYSESSRARSLLDLIRSGARIAEAESESELHVSHVAESLTLDEIREQMPNQVQMIQYAVLKDKLLIWLITKSDFTSKIADVDSGRLADAIASSLKQISSEDEMAAAGSLRGLYDLLIKPVEELLDQSKLICIVPDKELNYIPFSALISTKSGRYLVQDYRLTLSPSATVFINCTMAARKRETAGAERLLVVGNPSFDLNAFPQLPDLAAAEREAEKIAAYYRAPRVLLRSRATVARVKNELEEADVVHFAAHYVIDLQSSLSSKLLLAKPEGNDAPGSGALESSDVHRMKLNRTRLIVLSACQTGIERQYRGEGAISFARPFIAKGVPLIVASLWPVDSEATSELMIAFHRHRKVERLPTAEALQRAQRDMLESENRRYRQPNYWAAFVAVGGYSSEF
jgi:CHAT domain-containing protein/tetratricopeptide (TPR) repeat protein